MALKGSRRRSWATALSTAGKAVLLLLLLGAAATAADTATGGQGWTRAAHLMLQEQTRLTDGNIMAKCGWSPFQGHTFTSRVQETWVNGTCVWDGLRITTQHGDHVGQRLSFAR